MQWSFCNLQRWSLAWRVELRGTVPWTPVPVSAHRAKLSLLWTTTHILLSSTSKTLYSFRATVQTGFYNIIVPWACFDYSKQTDISWQIFFLADTWISPKHACDYLCFQAVPPECSLTWCKGVSLNSRYSHGVSSGGSTWHSILQFNITLIFYP